MGWQRAGRSPQTSDSHRLASLASDLTTYPQVLVNVPVRDKVDLQQVPAVRSAIERIEACVAGKGRLVVRYSGTEPLLRVMLDARLQLLQARELDFVRRVVAESRRRRAGARAVDEAEARVETDVINQFQRELEVRVGFARKSHNEVGRNADRRTHLPQAPNDRLIFERAIAALHRRQYAV